MSTITQRLQDLNNQHDNAIAVLGGAYFAEESARKGDLATFCEFLPAVVTHAKFYKWHTGVAGALRTFCHLCYVDPALIEVYLGMKFKDLEVAQHV